MKGGKKGVLFWKRSHDELIRNNRSVAFLPKAGVGDAAAAWPNGGHNQQQHASSMQIIPTHPPNPHAPPPNAAATVVVLPPHLPSPASSIACNAMPATTTASRHIMSRIRVPAPPRETATYPCPPRVAHLPPNLRPREQAPARCKTGNGWDELC